MVFLTPVATRRSRVVWRPKGFDQDVATAFGVRGHNGTDLIVILIGP